jgi:hypothetical protein
MTTIFDDLEDRLASIGPVTLEVGLEQDITVDPTGVFPRFQEWYQSTISQVSTGAAFTALNLGGGFEGIEEAVGEPIPSQRTRNRAIVTTSGHSSRDG